MCSSKEPIIYIILYYIIWVYYIIYNTCQSKQEKVIGEKAGNSYQMAKKLESMELGVFSLLKA